MTCRTCRHWLPIDDHGNGECHRNAPSPESVYQVNGGKRMPLIVAWPAVKGIDGCGEWRKREKATADVAALTRAK